VTSAWKQGRGRPAPVKRAKTLETLARAVAGARWAENQSGDPGAVMVSGIAYDSRRVRPGDLFCAIPGFRTDGHLYVADAAAKGAVAALVERPAAVPAGMPAVVVPHAREAMAAVSDAFFDSPSLRLWTVGVTGTNGKTTTTHLIRAVFEASGVPCGLTGTVHTLIGREERPVEHTTPEAPDLQALLAEMVEAGLTAAVMEVSSHALALARVDRVWFDVGVFTNLTQDHLDFHQTFEEYFRAKARLFERLGQGPAKAKGGPRAAVLNRDDPHWERLARLCAVPVVTYGLHPAADVRAEAVASGTAGSDFAVVLRGGWRGPAHVPLPGRFNVQNALAALAVGMVWGLDPDRMVAALAQSPGVAGRFERIDCGQPFTVIVDYAHTPDGMENVLKAARELAAGQVGVVFGAGGDRDRGKRPLMGRVAGERADWAVVTSDNPRSEDPLAIIAEVVAGIEAVTGRYAVEPDRARAIAAAIDRAGPGDVVLILGKGHETYQIFRDRTIHFDDREVARQVLRERGYGS
jgi:UDP-N-acetylmuramoyl-L-alanyl-D-glutamate--2,6-diaminopimelate ligase